MNDNPEEIEKLIGRLESLHRGSEVEEMIVACGGKAVPFLRNYLIHGEPSHIYQPRQRAVRALAKLDAKKELVEYLVTPRDISDPVTRFGEEAVASTAARLLARWRTDDISELLLQIANERKLPGVIEALGTFRRQEAIPLFIAALADDVSRPAAEQALNSMGAPARKALMEVVLMDPHDPGKGESPSNVLRRRSAMRVLRDGGIGKEEWSKLRALLHDNDVEISILAALMAMDAADRRDKIVAIKRLIGRIPAADWYCKLVIENILIEHYVSAEKEIKHQIRKRMRQGEKEQAADNVLRILRHVVRQASGEPIDI